MTNPYRPPTIIRAVANSLTQTESVKSVAVLLFGLLPAAIIISRVIVAVRYPQLHWDSGFLLRTIGPPLYLTGVWLFAIYVERRGGTMCRILLLIALLPLILLLVLIWYLSIAMLIEDGKSELEGWIAVSHLLWLAASVPVTAYFLASVLCVCRLRANRPQRTVEAGNEQEVVSQ